ncbi:MAG: DNA replication/repair protein RecF [Candidatus Saccharibacteria bacterium]|nr:DNA replication/repair protein RecF [Candidatus Saccharibacteria bacterium]
MISTLSLKQFRSYHDASFEFEPGVNIIVGPNASGKTNLLEAILVLANGRSYRAKDRELLRTGQEWARLDALADKTPRTLKLQTKADSARVEKVLEVDGVAKKRLTLQDTVPVVLFEPTDLQLLTGSPARRRSFLDTLLSRSEPDFARQLRIYERSLAQRNTLLKTGHMSKDELFVWNVRLSESGGKIIASRAELIKRMNTEINGHYKDVAHEDKHITVAYQTDVSAHHGTQLMELLEKNIKLDEKRGFTSVGPHRDDMLVEFEGRPVTETASRGEVRTLVLGFKMLELSIIEASRGQKPLLLLDDVFSELDGSRRKALTDFLKDHQTFITTTDADVVVDHFMKKTNVIAL